jgi:hypothetical protein
LDDLSAASTDEWPSDGHEKEDWPLTDSPLQFFGAGEMNRTPDLLITNELLYRLSYTG